MYRGQQRYWIGLIHLKKRPDFQMKFKIFKKIIRIFGCLVLEG